VHNRKSAVGEAGLSKGHAHQVRLGQKIYYPLKITLG